MCGLVVIGCGGVTDTNDEPVLHTVSVQSTGSGIGSITSSLGACEAALCEFEVPEDSTAAFTAIAGSKSTFDGWSGGGCKGNPCEITVTSDVVIESEFVLVALPTNLEELAVAAGASHVYAFQESNPSADTGACDGGCANMSITGGAKRTASPVPGTQGALVLSGITHTGFVTADDGWGRTADRTIEVVFRITATSGSRSLFMGPGTDFAAKTMFAQVTTVTGDGGLAVQKPGWVTSTPLDTAVNLLDQVVYLAISYDHATHDQITTWKISGQVLHSVTVTVGEGETSSGKFCFGGNTGACGGGNIHTLPSEFYHFAVYDSVLSRDDVDARIAMLQL